MGDKSGARRSKGPLVAVSVALTLCLLVAGGVVYLVGRISAAVDGWEPPTAAETLSAIPTPPHDQLTGPPAPAEVAPDGAASADPEADEQQTPGASAAPRPGDVWLDEVSEATTVPRRALEGYATAQLVLAQEQPECNLSWPTLAGIGYVESLHGTYAGGEIGPDGTTTVDIIGIPLNGTNNTRAIRDTDGGELDGDTEWDRAVGPMQFIPTTWERWGASPDGTDPDPHDIDDAALTAGRYLCAEGRDLTVAEDWEAAVFEYNHSGQYIADVLAYAHAYADAS
ncbi:lytic transglycosylase domain-containing protein [Nocardiopsis algeriensis]|uniref:Membrane-bound lytic murein transglycosylase B n=1 Tax=Nocardiopsis algeriensis TaxID=1478215 RepID=A0A841INZ4_9ACTN|nr:lytic transglycosylase domain-containing protein [Nocardiopsis algeriensis]MBB6118986.1 membrane-bound lytic murein transglycosylase B [Nocardiopsis algeriensis]